MHLLPKKKIISAFRGIVSLSDYSDLPITTSMVERIISPATNPQLWEYEFPHSAINLSRPFDSQDCVRVMGLSSTSLYDIRIDHTDEPFSENIVTVKRLISVPSLDRFYFATLSSAQGFGPDRGVLYFSAGPEVAQLHLLEYVPGFETPDFVPVVKKIKNHRKIIHRPLFDTGSGRVVIFFVGRFVVVDLALIHKDL